ncbi:MAG TPA: class I SAM-dependent methyltransferase [Mesorhizobium sp.]|jgi:SAM-dependent MidA family methyltransferase|uniref:class I SAM-dependent methyltransferase n=1 Tax=Mesorhizobium sp. TaxID=1871066 RepID=UPI002DDD1249|nr:class I SAM-dependent methyltransferase [Mesorhizobium sp.]HEV2505638.1 class I SAM-dependent methyltransferase [Mesorhizobium sp.]
MSGLKRRIIELITTVGAIPASEYMALCLFDPEAGYYTTREPFGAGGDFITAPEVSQMFGELVAVWFYEAWRAIGSPMPVTLAEIGPGRGTLMKDMLRTLQRLDPAFATGASIAFIETSPRLRQVQKDTLADMAAGVEWHETAATLLDQPILIVGNELFDAVPIRQFVRTTDSWHERMVGLDENGDLAFYAGAASLDSALLPPDAETALDGSIVELAPARSALMQTIADRIAAHGGVGLFFDYGHLQPGLGDTLQALRNHQYEDVLASPGEADLTSHVDFAALAASARAAGLRADSTTQGAFLLAMGLLERAGRLGADAGEATRERLSGEVERLAGPQAMGELFKVLAIAPTDIALPVFRSRVS